ncbi:MAG: hypothetical protein AVDCRST_MAG51-2650 [uncultured Ramlibacter sp.]|uniref:Uncharacterized protein n=1 Tax=uncultured Ramlibacter sp. TaxID=260755 RepID=A0A6J4Q2Z7_9BURK|nr:MAG: hypothetical protein AVDCRST_MAG51-2650 [uncultured Ramlibacter sp.]
MCPTDTTPDPRDMLRAPEAQDIPEPMPGREGDSRRVVDAKEIARRPGLPERPEIMAADVEDEDADPVVDTGPGIEDGALNRK